MKTEYEVGDYAVSNDFHKDYVTKIRDIEVFIGCPAKFIGKSSLFYSDKRKGYCVFLPGDTNVSKILEEQP